MWIYKSYYHKVFQNLFQKIITIARVLWNHRIMLSLKISHVFKFLLSNMRWRLITRRCYTIKKRTCSSRVIIHGLRSTIQRNRNNRIVKHKCTLPPPNRNKWNTNASRINSKKSTTTSYVCSDSKTRFFNFWAWK